MSLKVRFRGRIDDLRLIRDFEDRILKLASAFGSRVSLWRSSSDTAGCRLIRGLLVHLSPGQSPASLLLNHAGQLIASTELNTPVEACPQWPRWCTVHTASSGVDGHAAVVELLSLMKAQWFSDLQVLDLSGYWEHRDRLQLDSHLLQRVQTRLPLPRLALPGRPDAVDYPVALESARQAVGVFSALVEHVGRPIGPGQHLVSPFRDVTRMSFADRVRDAEELLLQQRIEEDQLLRATAEAIASGLHGDDPASTNADDATSAQSAEQRRQNDTAWNEDTAAGDTGEGPASRPFNDGEPLHGRADSSHVKSADDEAPGSVGTDTPLQEEALALSMDALQSLTAELCLHGFSTVLQTALLDLVGSLGRGEPIARGQARDGRELCDAIVHLRQSLRATCFAEGAVSGLFGEGKISLVTAARWLSRLQRIYHETQRLLTRAWSRGRRAA